MSLRPLLKSLEASRNNLSGSIPGSITSSLCCLLALKLTTNKLSGLLPAALGRLTTLRAQRPERERAQGKIMYARLPPLLHSLARRHFSGEERGGVEILNPPAARRLGCISNSGPQREKNKREKKKKDSPPHNRHKALWGRVCNALSCRHQGVFSGSHIRFASLTSSRDSFLWCDWDRASHTLGVVQFALSHPRSKETHIANVCHTSKELSRFVMILALQSQIVRAEMVQDEKSPNFVFFRRECCYGKCSEFCT